MNIKNTFLLVGYIGLMLSVQAQLSPAVTAWLQNTTETGSYYMAGNSTPINNGILYNCQIVEYSDNYVYVHTNGIPSYPTGPFQDGNPSQAESQDLILRFTLNPQEETGVKTATTPGKIGAFINGVSLYDYRDGVAWNPNTNTICGGPGNAMCPGGPMASQDWNRDAIPAEMAGFDCSKAHPAMGDYHHHQNPSAFKLDLDVVSNVCNLYDADGLYAIDSTSHSPLIGYAYDGFPIYGAYGFKNADGTDGIVRIKSGYQLRDITTRTTHADGTDVDDGPDVGGEFFLGYFREDYEFIANAAEDYLDEHNGRFCVTPEYPDGTYAYFATVDENWNSAYPYVVGPTFYGVYENAVVSSVSEPTTTYTPSVTSISEAAFNELEITVFPNPSAELIAIQLGGLVVDEDMKVDLLDTQGRRVLHTEIKKGQTIAYFDVQTVYDGTYFVKISTQKHSLVEKVLIVKE
ncbi:MAG: YHYH protein [Bacteroidota bacterium]